MIRYLAAGVKHAFGLHHLGRRLPVRPDDILLASYPESGDIWLQFLIANLLYPDQQVAPGNLHHLIVDPDKTSKRGVDRVRSPRVVNSHSSFDPRYRRVIYLVRDPRDVARAQYVARPSASNNNFGVNVGVEDVLTQFLAGGPERCYGTWGENVGSWLGARSAYSGFLLVRYEDLQTNTARELIRVAKFAGWPSTPEIIARAIERSSNYETAKSEKTASTLPAQHLLRIESAWGDIMSLLEYELMTRKAGQTNPSLIELLATGAAGGAGRELNLR